MRKVQCSRCGHYLDYPHTTVKVVIDGYTLYLCWGCAQGVTLKPREILAEARYRAFQRFVKEL